ncbi:MAG TPA: hypothetical protein VNK41_11265 [Vicinamibacterales bacterium]|nr:hypothetical protein [Vicinamibacterales bacterium]
MFAARTLLSAVLLLAAAATACGSRVDLASSVELVDVTTGWFDAGVTPEGKNKLVPSISLRIRNKGQERLGSTQLNLIFRRVNEEEVWSTSYVRGIGSEGLAPGETTEPIVVRAQQGYTGEQPRAQMLSNSQFVDAKVTVFGKRGSANWARLGEFQIARQLLTE